jgi:hypothetical protein
MAKFRKGRGKSISSRSQSESIAFEAAMGRRVPDHELNVLGLGNVIRRFDLDESGNAPSVILRTIYPYNAFIRGYSALGDISDQDPNSATDVAVADPTTAITPITDLAKYIESDVWPVLSNLFSSGTGVRHDVSINEFVRYFAMMGDAYSFLLYPMMLNRLVFHFDWMKVSPGTDVVPKFLYQLVENLQATDVGIAELWLPLMKRMENKIIFPRYASEIKRMMTPMLSIDLHGRLLLPVRGTPATTGATTRTKIEGYLDYIDVNLADASNLFSSFLPFPFKSMMPWELPEGPVIDVDRASGWYNSGCKGHDTFGDTGDPTNDDAMLCDEADNDVATLFSRHVQPIWSEVKLASIWSLSDDITDDEYYLITPHQYDQISLVDDSFDEFDYDGTVIVAGSLGYRYLSYPICRFAAGNVTHGMQEPGTFGALLNKETLQRMMRLETSFLFSLEALKEVTRVSAGASIRELRWSISQRIQDNLEKGI